MSWIRGLWQTYPTGCAVALLACSSLALMVLPASIGSVYTAFSFIFFLFSLFLLSLPVIAKSIQWSVGILSLLFIVPWIGLHHLDYLDVMTQVGLFATLAMGLNLVVGMVGLLDLGFIAFFAVGAYTWGILGSTQLASIWTGYTGWPAWAFFPALPLGALLAGGMGVLLGLPVLRVKGDYLALVTLGFGEVIRVLLNNLDKPLNLTGGPSGIASIAQPFAFLAEQLARWTGIESYRWQALCYYFLVCLIVLASIWMLNRLVHSPIGWAWEAIREDEMAAQAMGIPRIKMKLLAFAMGASIAGAMGVVFAAKQMFISPDSFDFNQSISILAMVVLGGCGSIRGAVVGAAVMVVLNMQVLKGMGALLSSLKAAGTTIGGWSFSQWPAELEPAKYERLLFGVLIWVMMIYRPEGLLPPHRPTYPRQKNAHREAESRYVA
jgi:branched-chain amino acid transport system permease protein